MEWESKVRVTPNVDLPFLLYTTKPFFMFYAKWTLRKRQIKEKNTKHKTIFCFLIGVSWTLHQPKKLNIDKNETTVRIVVKKNKAHLLYVFFLKISYINDYI